MNYCFSNFALFLFCGIRLSLTIWLTLQESLVIQQEGADRLREATVRQAASRLAAHHAHEKAAFQAHKTAAAEEPALTTADAAKIVDTRWRDTQLGWLIINTEIRFVCLNFKFLRNYFVLGAV